MNFSQFIESACLFFQNLEEQMNQNKIFLPAHWSIDHLCYRVETWESYLAKRAEFSQFGKLLGETEVNGRPISTFKLSESLPFLNRKIDLVELPAPKNDKKTREGFEHIEVVCDKTFLELKDLFVGSPFEEKGIGKDFNSELELKLDGLAIKFHHLSLESVVTLENQKQVFQALKQSNLLRDFKEFHPLVAGSLPLGIGTQDSDLDVLLCHPHVEEVLSKIQKIYGNEPLFHHKGGIGEGGEKYGMARFTFSDVKFELFVEATETIRQRAYVHFQVEERLLKLGGEPLRKKIKVLRQKGLKTEPAFAKALGLKGDPYLQLMEIHGCSEAHLESLVKSALSETAEG